MFKKRIKAARCVFFTIAALTVLIAVFWKISERYSKGTGELKVFFGTPDTVDGVTVSRRVSERIRQSEGGDYETAIRQADHFYKTRTARIAGNQTVTDLGVRKQREYEPEYRLLYVSLQSEAVENLLTTYYEPDLLTVLIKDNHPLKSLSYDLVWLLNEGYTPHIDKEYRIEDYVTFDEEDCFWYCSDHEGGARLEYRDGTEGEGHESGWIEAEFMRLSYTGIELQEQEGAFYAFLDMEPKCEGTPEFHMTVNKGLYRFDTEGTATCVLPMGERAEGFEFLWLIKEEEENTLAIVGKKENCLVAYCYNLESGTVGERVLWDGKENPEELEKWWETAEFHRMADMEIEGERSYICYTDGTSESGEVNVIVFDSGERIFFGEVLPEERECETLSDFSMNTNEFSWIYTAVDKVEIRLPE